MYLLDKNMILYNPMSPLSLKLSNLVLNICFVQYHTGSLYTDIPKQESTAFCENPSKKKRKKIWLLENGCDWTYFLFWSNASLMLQLVLLVAGGWCFCSSTDGKEDSGELDFSTLLKKRWVLWVQHLLRLEDIRHDFINSFPSHFYSLWTIFPL